jgi:hypothetical protein
MSYVTKLENQNKELNMHIMTFAKKNWTNRRENHP